MSDFTLYMIQRLSALILVPLVAGHLGVMIYAVRDGLTAAEILARTQGSLAWGAFYGLFVLAVAVHAAIGLRVILAEITGARGAGLAAFSIIAFLVLLGTGGWAVIAVTWTP